MTAGNGDTYPRQAARTRRFSLGQPRDLAVAHDGSRVIFLRSLHGEDPVNRLWALDVGTGAETLVADPEDLAAPPDELPAAERARRERRRETAGGIVTFAGDRRLATIAFALGGRLFLASEDVGRWSVRPLETSTGAFDPRPDLGGVRIAYVADHALHVVDVEGGSDRALAREDGATWGRAEFIAAEEMGRSRGYWWSPAGDRLAVARVDERAVRRWHIADPVDPDTTPTVVAYPAAGTTNADVSLWVVDLEGARREVVWDRHRFEYLARVSWREGDPLTLLVQSRDQRDTQVLVADPDTGAVEVVRSDHDRHWVELVDGSPAWLPGGTLVTTVDDGDTRRLAFDGEPVTPPGLQVRRILHAGDGGVLVAASSDDPTEVHVWLVRGDADLRPLTAAPGVHSAVAGGGTVVVLSATLEETATAVTVEPAVGSSIPVASHVAVPAVEPRVRFLELGHDRLRGALLLPRGDDERLPVLLDPYGGPHMQRVVRARGRFLEAQWFANQGFAVLAVDGRGTPGRGPAWERAVHLDLARGALEDQVRGLEAAAASEPRLDLTRVAIRGWSFGGYLAALAVLRRPDVFHAAVAGAPVTDWRLYDTHYTERYLGHPGPHPEAYERSSLLSDAAHLERPLLLIHGVTDDNVVVAHTLRLSRALLEAGRPHAVLPLSGVTHMTPQEVVAENLLRVQLAFLHAALHQPAT